ncbi:MAG TPA: RNA polymerase sigma factor [Flavobacteriaceae bacterium]|nr:RNA polymerase sigma factor [Flavobacteriaceae bacterium]
MVRIIPLHKNPNNLIEAAKKGDRRAQQRLFKQYSPVMLSICRRYIVSIDLAEEVMLAGFLKTFLNINSYSYEGSFEGWIKRIMINESISFLRKEARFEHESQEALEQSDYAVEMDHELELEEIQKLIDELPEGYKMVFILFVIEGYKHVEIAQMLEISENTSKTQLFKARKMLQKKIVEHYSSHYETGEI